MTGDDVEIALAALDYDIHMASKVFDCTVRTIQKWRREGCPAHVALVIDALLEQRITWRGAKWMLRRIGRTRSDGAHTHKRTSSSRSRERLSA